MSDLPVFHAGNLPAHHTNPDTDGVTDWPRSPTGVEYMPMSGAYCVETATGRVTCKDGFIVICPDGSPAWVPDEPDW